MSEKKKKHLSTAIGYRERSTSRNDAVARTELQLVSLWEFAREAGIGRQT